MEENSRQTNQAIETPHIEAYSQLLTTGLRQEVLSFLASP